MLGNLLDMFFSSANLHTWSIYEEKSGHITVKLRFEGECSHTGVNMGQSGQATFKRKNEKQTYRDRTRAKEHQQSKKGVTTRSMAKNRSVEKPRFGDSEMSPFTGMSQFNNHASISPCTPVNTGDMLDTSSESHGPLTMDTNMIMSPVLHDIVPAYEPCQASVTEKSFHLETDDESIYESNATRM